MTLQSQTSHDILINTRAEMSVLVCRSAAAVFFLVLLHMLLLWCLQVFLPTVLPNLRLNVLLLLLAVPPRPAGCVPVVQKQFRTHTAAILDWVDLWDRFGYQFHCRNVQFTAFITQKAT